MGVPHGRLGGFHSSSRLRFRFGPVPPSAFRFCPCRFGTLGFGRDCFFGLGGWALRFLFLDFFCFGHELTTRARSAAFRVFSSAFYCFNTEVSGRTKPPHEEFFSRRRTSFGNSQTTLLRYNNIGEIFRRWEKLMYLAP